MLSRPRKKKYQLELMHTYSESISSIRMNTKIFHMVLKNMHAIFCQEYSTILMHVCVCIRMVNKLKNAKSFPHRFWRMMFQRNDDFVSKKCRKLAQTKCQFCQTFEIEIRFTLYTYLPVDRRTDEMNYAWWPFNSEHKLNENEVRAWAWAGERI